MRILVRTAAIVLATTMTGPLLAPSLAAAALGDVTEWTLPTSGAAPQGIARGPDGALWFTERGSDRIGRITTDGVVSEFALPDGSGPTSIAAGPDGAMWFTEQPADRIGRISMDGTVTEHAVTPGSGPFGIAAGPDGAMWFTEQTANRIGRISMDGAVTEFPITTRLGSGPTGIAAGPDGAMWFTERAASRIGRIAMDGAVTDYPLPGGGRLPSSIALGPDGAMWFTSPGTSAIGRITTAGFASELSTPTASSGPQEIALGPDGALWFTELSANRIARVAPEGGIVEHPLPVEFSGPYGITAGPDGNVWFTELAVSAIGRLTIVEPDTAPPVVTIVEPTPDAAYMVGDVVTASYACTDTGGSGLASCVGTVPAGSPLDTSTPGVHVLEVAATDGAGHVTIATRPYLVFGSFDGRLVLPPAVATLRAGQPADVRFDTAAGALAPGAPFTELVACDTWAAIGSMEAATPSGPGLHVTGGRTTFRWRTEKAWAGTCRSLVLPFEAGVTLRLLVRFA